MRINRKNLKELSNRSLGSSPLVMPNLASSNFLVEQLGKTNLGFLTVEDKLDFAEQYNYIAYIYVHYSTFIRRASHLCKELQWKEESIENDLEIKKSRRLKTPYGELKEKTVCHKKNQLTYHVEEIVKSKDDVKAVGWIVRESVKTILNQRSDIKKDLLNQIVPKVRQINGRGLSVIHFWTPITEILYPHFSQEKMIYFLHDYPDLARELMDMAMQYTQLLIEVGIEARVDAMQTALWGYEQWAPAIYEEYVLPYVIPISNQVREGGCLFWVHTCGYMKGLIEQKMYHRFEPDILECLNYPPAGDVDDWPRLRYLLPEETITKGNLEDSLLWKGPIEEIKMKTKQILVESEGFKHISGTSNNVFDGTPLVHFEAMMEAVAEYNKVKGFL
jgi:hypothetical protein